MKYVVLQKPSALTVVVASLTQTHADLAAPYVAQGYTPQSAGFVRFLAHERFQCFGRSASLGLGPHADDPRLLSALHGASLRAAELSTA